MTFIDVGDNRLYVQVEGAGDPVVLLHGWPTHGQLWRAQVPVLAETRRVIVPDLPGYGKSPVPTPVRFSFDYYSDAVEGLINELGLDRCALVGHDVGGPVAMLVATRRPDLTTKLVLLNTTPYPEVSRLLRLMARAGRLSALRSFLTSRRGFGLLFRAGLVQADRKAAADRYYDPVAEDPARRQALGKMLIDLDFADLEGLVGRLTDAHIPTAIIWAEKDPTSPPSVARQLHTELPDSTLEMIEDCGHFLTEDRPKEVTRALVAALNE